MAYKVKNWAQFQHFKDRSPPWIKLYRGILDDLDWHKLDAKSSKMLVMIWLIASENEGALPDDETLSFRLRISETELKTSLSKLSHWLYQDDINVISERNQGDVLERETETERKKEKEGETKKNAIACPPDVDQQTWDDWLALRKAKKAPVTQTVIDGAKREAAKAGMTLETFFQVWCRRGSQGLEAAWLHDSKGDQIRPTGMLPGAI